MRVDEPVTLEHTIFGRRLRVRARRRDDGRAEADDPVAEHGALPRRPRRHRRDGLSRHGRFWADLTAAYREEITRLGELGCTYLQLDDTSLAYLNDPTQREHVVEIGGDPEHQHEAYIRYLNEAIASRPDGMRITTHMCRGNFRSSWFASGGLRATSPRCCSNELAVDGFFME